MRYAAVLCFLLAPQLPGAACHCLISHSACGEVADSNLVFIGTVEAIQPALLNPWQPGGRRDWMNDPDLVALRKNKSASGVQALKARYLRLLPDLPDEERLRLQSAQTQDDLQGVMTWIITQGSQVRFKVRTLFQQKKDEDDDDDSASAKKDEDDAQKDDAKKDQKKDDDDAPVPESLDVWNEAGDCGIPFQKGETYLVYASSDEESDHIYTSICHRTTRLSDAGDDLAYLYFFQNDHAHSARLEGLLTADIDQLSSDRFHESDRIKSPVADVLVKLSMAGGDRYTESDTNGRFVFDGLAPGDYQLSVWEADFPDQADRLAGPRKIHVQAGQCSFTKLLVLTRGSGR